MLYLLLSKTRKKKDKPAAVSQTNTFCSSRWPHLSSQTAANHIKQRCKKKKLFPSDWSSCSRRPTRLNPSIFPLPPDVQRSRTFPPLCTPEQSPRVGAAQSRQRPAVCRLRGPAVGNLCCSLQSKLQMWGNGLDKVQRATLCAFVSEATMEENSLPLALKCTRAAYLSYLFRTMGNKEAAP